MTTAVLFAVGLVAYGTAINVLRVPDGYYTTLNIGAGGIAVVTAMSVPGVDLAEVGLDRPRASAVAISVLVAACAAVAVPLAVRWGRRSPRVAAALDDGRLRGMDTAEVVGRATTRIPVGTAGFEEVAFRGALLAVLATQLPMAAAVAGSSLAFGLWHLAPTWRYLEANGVRQRAAPLALAVVATAAAGVVLCVLRLVTGGLLVPWTAHGAVNVGALVAAHLHQRDRQRE